MAKSLYQPRWASNSQERQMFRRQAEETMRLRGDNRRPTPPRSVTSQTGSRKAVVSWSAPQDLSRVDTFRVYRDGILYDTLSDPAARSSDIAVTAGSTVCVEVCSVSKAGIESAKISVAASATSEGGAPADPVTPPAAVESSDSDQASREKTIGGRLTF